MELAEGVHALELAYDFEDRHMEIHPAVVETDRGLLLVDVGLPGSLEKIEGELDDAGLSLVNVDGVVLTHHDGDHAGGLAEVLEHTGATVYAHREESPYVDGREPPVKGDPDDRYPPVDVDIELLDGVTFRTRAGPMETVATPGHAPGHVSLYFPEADLLIAGDALTAEGGELAGPKPEFTPDMTTAIESVGRLADLDVAATLCYHGGFVEAGTDRIRAVYESLQE